MAILAFRNDPWCVRCWSPWSIAPRQEHQSNKELALQRLLTNGPPPLAACVARLSGHGSRPRVDQDMEREVPCIIFHIQPWNVFFSPKKILMFPTCFMTFAKCLFEQRLPCEFLSKLRTYRDLPIYYPIVYSQRLAKFHQIKEACRGTPRSPTAAAASQRPRWTKWVRSRARRRSGNRNPNSSSSRREVRRSLPC